MQMKQITLTSFIIVHNIIHTENYYWITEAMQFHDEDNMYKQ